jgi:3-dehydroquinate dehydratase-2
VEPFRHADRLLPQRAGCRLSRAGERCALAAARAGIALDFRWADDEGRLIDWVQEARGAADGLLLHAPALSCTSVAVLDALLLFDGPVIEIHAGHIHRPEAGGWSLAGRAATAILCGLGARGCELAVGAMARLIAEAGRRPAWQAAGFHPLRG